MDSPTSRTELPRDARVLVLAAEQDVASDLCRIIERSGVEARAATHLEDVLTMVHAWNPTHVAVGLDLDDDRLQATQQALGDRPYDGMVVVRGTVDAELADVIRTGDGIAATALDVSRFGAVFDRRQPFGAPMHTERRRDPRTVRRAVADLDAALDAGEFHVVYQPKVRCRDGRLEALEGLARWRRPDGTLVAPEAFITLAEATGRVERLTETIFEQAMTWIAAQLGASDVRLCLNLSAFSLADADLPDRIGALCRATGLPPERLVLEVTETSAAADPDTAYEVLCGLRDKGMWVALDDFGAGHASLLQLARHPFTDLKIDKGLVRTVHRSDDSRTIIRAVVNLARSLSMRVVAEGVEDAATFTSVRELGCDMVQGFHVSEPLEGDAVLGWMAAGGARGLLRPPTVRRY